MVTCVLPVASMKQMKCDANPARQFKGYYIHFSFLFALLVFFVFFLFLAQLAVVQEPPYAVSPVIESVTWDFANLVGKGPGSDI